AAAREAAAGLGEQSRVLAEVPMVLLAVDRTTALVRDGATALVLRPSALLDGVLALGELLWERAVPLVPAARGAHGLSDEDGRLLALSASGLTDRAIARRLGVAQRTVERRMRRIMNVLGARTRFQAGLRAAELTRGAGPPDDPRGA
ncbi:transcriptional regulator TrmB, partial [Streptomyces sp. SID5473]